MATTSRAEVDRIVSASAWARFPALLESVERWAELAGDEARDLVVSACPLGFEWLSIRVSRVERDGLEADWLEWLAPLGFAKANRLALDHWATRELHSAASKLKARDGTGLRPRKLVDPESTEGTSNGNGSGSQMAKTKAKTDDGRGVPPPRSTTRSRASTAEAAAPAPAKPGKKPGRKPATRKAESPAVAETRSKPGPKPKAKAKAKPGPKPRAK
jgi:hypothetical protein